MTRHRCAFAARIVTALLLSVWVAYAALFWWIQESVLFPVPTWMDAPGLAAIAEERGIEVLALEDDRGQRILGWHHDAGADRLVVFLSGNGEALSDYLDVHTLLVDAGWDTLTVAWTGYPGSDGEPSQAAMAANAEADTAWEALQGR